MKTFIPNKIKKILAGISTVSLVIAFNCKSGGDSENLLSGEWESLWAGSQNISIGFNINFENNHTFRVTAFGAGQTQPMKISGIYWIARDTMTILDKLEEPMQLCSYTDTGKYTFKKHSDTVFFKVIKDGCERRKITLEIGLVKERQGQVN